MESYPGNCYDGDTTGWNRYMRKHNPFMGFENIRLNASRCANIVNADQLYTDLDNENVCACCFLLSLLCCLLCFVPNHTFPFCSAQLPHFSYYTPNMDNDAHDTNITYAGEYLIQFLPPLLNNAVFMKNTLVVVTWDEDNYTEFNRVMTFLLGPNVKSGNKSTK